MAKDGVKQIINGFYGSENPGVKASLYRILMHGKLGGSGKLIILPVDQGFEHGPDKSFIKNILAYDPIYHHSFAVESGVNAYAAPIGMLECSVGEHFGSVPLILKLNSASAMFPKSAHPDQAFTSTIKDALRLGCSAVGITIYPGSLKFKHMLEEASEIIKEAKCFGLPTVVWAYPRGGDLEKNMETSLDVIAYSAHTVCLLGAHMVKVKLPSSNMLSKDIGYGDISTLAQRIKIVKRSCFAGKRLVIFSGGETKDRQSILSEIQSIKEAGGDGSIIGRNFFQRPRAEALALLSELIDLYKT